MIYEIKNKKNEVYIFDLKKVVYIAKKALENHILIMFDNGTSLKISSGYKTSDMFNDECQAWFKIKLDLINYNLNKLNEDK